ncbi:MAG: bifunctional DNA-formamidopyrimidine glycosylase/DNA-(apurinic or apyrimidinic site) lyase [Victivallales bacterium]|nr:bifunctional DNA-formamidopyrimidine glycosylase/DNA-(apurinic or apyrimidinic site) lyase [Victivallales bacterium]MBT7161154.1 bifunctional DNA-formamidopyrimidine glycosylase/DNA-(apurinic or apyrimidinic site) lyase [Victivallales bacterium]MBT7304078.1 bifunctional DNA-formamidopyrimidine glycosylase/DNA-(apurinic or apyrimidinic site) lyase [Victivallales bacterium]
MPELPEVETVRRALARHLPGATVTAVELRVDRLRKPLSREQLEGVCVGRGIRTVRRRAKYLLVDLDDGGGLRLHLGMTGSMRVDAEGVPALPHDRICWPLADGRVWRFNDPRRFGSAEAYVDLQAAEPDLFAAFGPEPLEDTFTGAYLRGASHGRRASIKSLIMDQRIVVGVGNIYASESLHRAGILPSRQGGRVSAVRCQRLAEEIKEVLAEAIELGGTTISDFRAPDGSEGRFTVHLGVYGRDGQDCPRCGPGHAVRRRVLAGRGTFYCPNCQR